MMFDGKSEAKLCGEIWLIKHKITGEFVFEYRTYQGNKKKAFFNSFRYAEEALEKYIKNPYMYYIVKMKGGATDTNVGNITEKGGAENDN